MGVVKRMLCNDAYVGIECLYDNYQTLHLLYPNCVFIVLVTSSIVKADSQKELPLKINSDLIGNIRNSKNNLFEFITYFKDEKDRIFVTSIDTNLDWHSLCGFLNCKIPPCDFPKVDTIAKVYNYDLIPSSEKIVDFRDTVYLHHDVTPWIIPIERLPAFGISQIIHKAGLQVGRFAQIFQDSFLLFEENRWMILETSFPSNLADFTADNFELCEAGGFYLALNKQKLKQRKYASASIASSQSFLFGRFEVVMKAVKLDGVVTAFFLHRNDPWQELDIEFLGKDTSKVLLNVYFNPGTTEFGWNYGNRGTPILLDLGFDAAADYHKYAIEWEPHEIRWFVDDILVQVRAIWGLTPIPNQPMKVYLNLWPSLSEELAGVFIDDSLPVKLC